MRNTVNLAMIVFIIIAFTLCTALLSLTGCDSPEKYDPIINQQKEQQKLDEAVYKKYAADIEQLNDAKNKLAIELAKAREEAKDTAVLEARLIQIETDTKLKQASAQQVQAEQTIRSFVIAELEKQKAAAGDVTLQIGEGAQTVGRFLPAPWGEIVGTVGLLLAGFSETKRRQTKSAAIEAIGTFSTGIASGLIPLSENAKTKLMAAQSSAANNMVKEAQAEYRDAMILAEPTVKPA